MIKRITRSLPDLRTDKGRTDRGQLDDFVRDPWLFVLGAQSRGEIATFCPLPSALHYAAREFREERRRRPWGRLRISIAANSGHTLTSRNTECLQAGFISTGGPQGACCRPLRFNLGSLTTSSITRPCIEPRHNRPLVRRRCRCEIQGLILVSPVSDVSRR